MFAVAAGTNGPRSCVLASSPAVSCRVRLDERPDRRTPPKHVGCAAKLRILTDDLPIQDEHQHLGGTVERMTRYGTCSKSLGRIDPHARPPSTVRRPSPYTLYEGCLLNGLNLNGAYTLTRKGVGESIFSGFTHKSQSPPPEYLDSDRQLCGARVGVGASLNFEAERSTRLRPLCTFNGLRAETLCPGLRVGHPGAHRPIRYPAPPKPHSICNHH